MGLLGLSKPCCAHPLESFGLSQGALATETSHCNVFGFQRLRVHGGFQSQQNQDSRLETLKEMSFLEK